MDIMRKSPYIAPLAAGALIGLCSCDTGARVQHATPTELAATHERRGDQPVSKKMKVTIGPKSFTATLDDTPATAKLKALLPLTLDMSELNGNEKYSRLSTRFPTD